MKEYEKLFTELTQEDIDKADSMLLAIANYLVIKYEMIYSTINSNHQIIINFPDKCFAIQPDFDSYSYYITLSKEQSDCSYDILEHLELSPSLVEDNILHVIEFIEKHK